MKVLIDGDTLAMRAAFSAEDMDVWIACSRAYTSLSNIMEATKATSHEIWMSGKKNFRYQVFPEYKGNRIGMKRPTWEKDVKIYLELDHSARWSDGVEADDMLGIRHNELQAQGYKTILAHQDKDINQIAGEHYNFVKNEFYTVTPEEADRFFFYQLIVGDTTDNIKGIPGLGPKKAEKLLSQGSTPQEWYELIKEQYSCEEELDMNAKCLYIHRKHNDNWRNLIETSQRKSEGPDLPAEDA